METPLVRRYGVLLAVLLAWIASACASVPENQGIDDVPMYGQPAVPRPDFLKKADEQFVQAATAGFGSREAASRAWAAKAREHMKKNELHLAMRRYNQSWLLDPTNYQPYWGFGMIMLNRMKFDESLAHFEKAKQLLDDPYQRVALIADIGSAHSVWAKYTPIEKAAEQSQHFKEAYTNLVESTTMDASYAPAWAIWARTLYWEGKYTEAWEKVKKARALDEKVILPGFVTELASKQPES